MFGRLRSYYLLIEPLHDAENAVIGTTSVAVDVTERKASEEKLRLLLRELTHRSKNLLAVIQAIARQTASSTTSVEDFLQHFSNRLVAIGASHDPLGGRRLAWRIAARADRAAAARSHRPLRRADFHRGRDVMLKPEAIHNLGLALHELATNAQQYGALSAEAGRVAVRWQFNDDASKLKLVWEERGGPPVTVPERSGFGRAMVERVVGQALESDVTLSFAARGVRCVIVIPARHVVSAG